MKHATASAEETELGAIYANAREGTIFRQALHDMGHTQKSTPITTNVTTARAILDNNTPGRYLKGADMRLHWMKDRVKRNIFTIRWKAAQTNLGHYPTKAHKPAHHRKMRPICACNHGQSPAAMQGCASALGGIASVRQPITKPAWLARMKRKDGTTSTTNAAPQAQSPTQHRRLKSITGFSSRRRHNVEEPFGSASLLQQLRPVPPYSAPA